MEAALQRSLQLFNNDIERRKGERNSLLSIISEKEHEQGEVVDKIDLLQKVIKVYQLASRYARKQAKDTMERLVTSALSCVYPDDMTFKIEMDTENDTKAEADLVVVTKYDDYTVENDPEEGDGGGVSDVVSLAARISLLETARPYQGGPLVLDEPGKHLGVLNRNLAPFLTMVTNSFSRQIIMVTHDDYLAEAADRSFRVVKKDGVSKVTQVS
jgi:DNA repair exonuclease SbcCD ATPase subunit